MTFRQAAAVAATAITLGVVGGLLFAAWMNGAS